MRPTKRHIYLFHSPLLTQCTPPNIILRYSSPRYLPNAPLQTSRLPIPLHDIYPMRPSKRPVQLFHSPLFTQRAPPNVPFSYSIPHYLPNAPIQTSRLAIPFPAIYPMRPSKVPFSYSIPRYFPNASLQMSHLAIPFPAILLMRPSKNSV